VVKGNQTASSLPGLTFGPLLFCAADRIQTISPVARRASTIKYNSQANDLTVCTIEVPNHGGKKEKPGSSTDPGFPSGPTPTRGDAIAGGGLLMAWKSGAIAEGITGRTIAVGPIEGLLERRGCSGKVGAALELRATTAGSVREASTPAVGGTGLADSEP